MDGRSIRTSARRNEGSSRNGRHMNRDTDRDRYNAEGGYEG